MPAKITGPTISGVVQRDRVFRLLDDRMKKPVIWISAPAGSGKTTLVSSYLASRRQTCIWYQCDEGDADLPTFFYYMGLAAGKAAPRSRKALPLLTPEYLAGIPTFTRRYFERLFNFFSPARSSKKIPSAPNPGFAVVLDNYQDVPADSPFHDMIAAGLDAIPESACVFIISRSEPPAALARLQASDRIGRLEYRDVRFTLEESKKLLSGRMSGPDGPSIKMIHKYTQGWAAGIILLARSAGLAGTGSKSTEDAACERVFDYFAGEIFNRSGKEVQDFLVKTAFLPTLSVSMAGKLTGAGNAGRILEALNRDNFFTERLSGSGQEYLYHPLFRNFLLTRAEETFSAPELAAIQRKAALLLEESGRIEEAAGLYGRAGDGGGLARMIVRHARELLRQGRNRTVAEWIAGIPREAADRDPWILYWSGMCSFPFDMSRTRKQLEKAFHTFKAADDSAGLYLSWAGIVDTLAYELEEWERLDDCITAFKGLLRSYPSFPSKEIDLIASSRMLIALTLRKTDQPNQVEEWLERVTRLLQENPSADIEMDTVFCMSLYYLWKGEYNKNALLLEKAEAEILHRRPPPFAIIRVKLMKGIHYWITADYDAALRTLAEGLDVSQESGVHVFDSLMWSFRTAAEMASGHMERAEKSLQNQLAALLGPEKTLDIFFYRINSAWRGLLAGNPSLADENLQAVSARVTEIGTPYYRALWNIGMAQVAFQQGRTKDARTHVRSAHHLGRSMKSHVIEWYSLLVGAFFLLQEGMEEKGLPALRRGLALGRRHGYAHLEFYQPSVMQFLYAKALETGIEPEYVKKLIRKLGLTPPEALTPAHSSLCLENWPYPLRIYTLGRFEIIRDDEPLVFSGKVQKKPLEMLKAVIAFDGRNVPEGRVIDALWPDAEGDLAHKSFDMTLRRLRRLLGGNEFVRYSAGQLSIDPLRCWVDSLALGQVLEEIRKAADDQVAPLCRKAARLHRGPFLPADSHLHFALSRRETLSHGLLRATRAAGRHYEAACKWERAAECYLQGLDTDNLAEEFYRCLIVCYQKLGNNADAVKMYHRCRRLLRDHLGIEPSAETEAAYASIITGD